MQDAPRDVVVAYDIVSDDRRAAVAHCLKGFGVRVQYSVFECSLSARDMRRLAKRLERLVDREVDRLQFFECGRNSPFNEFADRAVPYWAV